MIQRLQTVYLAIVAILCAVGLFGTLGRFSAGTQIVATFNNFTFSAPNVLESAGPYVLGVLLILVFVLSIFSVLLFRKRMRQLRLTIFSTILLVGYVACFVYFTWIYSGKLELAMPDSDVSFNLALPALYPVVSIILNILAIRGIRKDEALVRSLDRIR